MSDDLLQLTTTNPEGVMQAERFGRGEVLIHAELVRWGWLPREGSFVMDAPQFSNVDDLKRLTSYSGRSKPNRVARPKTREIEISGKYVE